MSRLAKFSPIRSLGFASISASYASVGVPLSVPARGICITNNTEGDMFFTLDTSEDQIFVKAMSFKLWDVQSNIKPGKESEFVLPVGTQFSVKEITAPIAGDVYIEVLEHA